jgi:hypothetical protein
MTRGPGQTNAIRAGQRRGASRARADPAAGNHSHERMILIDCSRGGRRQAASWLQPSKPIWRMQEMAVLTRAFIRKRLVGLAVRTSIFVR